MSDRHSVEVFENVVSHGALVCIIHDTGDYCLMLGGDWVSGAPTNAETKYNLSASLDRVQLMVAYEALFV